MHAQRLPPSLYLSISLSLPRVTHNNKAEAGGECTVQELPDSPCPRPYYYLHSMVAQSSGPLTANESRTFSPGATARLSVTNRGLFSSVLCVRSPYLARRVTFRPYVRLFNDLASTGERAAFTKVTTPPATILQSGKADFNLGGVEL